MAILNKFPLFSVVVIAVFTLAPASNATMLSPGGTVTPVYTAFVPGDFGAVKADTGVVSFTGLDVSNNTRFTGKLREEVVVDTGTGFLDFIYQVLSTGGPDNIGKITTINYANVTINAGTCPTCADLIGGVGVTDMDPVNIGRSGSPGSIVAFNYGDPNGTLAPNDETSVLVLKTNSTTFAVGSTSSIDGATANIQTFDPTPEPKSAGLLLGGLFAVGLVVARKFQFRLS
jgi:hypothetical protein